jgi:hypothetical protein
MLRPRWLLGLSVSWLVGVALACSSDNSTGSDSGADGGLEASGSGSSSSGGSSSGSSSSGGASPMCDGSVAFPAAGADGAAPPSCVQCLMSNCSSQITACGPDCVCGPSMTCLLANGSVGFNHAYQICNTAEAALANGNMALMAVAGCTAMHCMCDCFGGTCDAGGD